MTASISTGTPSTLRKSAPHVILKVEVSVPRVITSFEGLGRGQGMGSVPVVGIEIVDAVVPLGEEEVAAALKSVAVSVCVMVIVLAASLFVVSVVILRVDPSMRGGAYLLLQALITAILPPTPPPTAAAMITHIKASSKKNVVGRKPQMVFLLPESILYVD